MTTAAVSSRLAPVLSPSGRRMASTFIYGPQPYERTKRVIRYVGSAAIFGGVALWYKLERSVRASDLAIMAPDYPWNHKGLFSSLDHASIRRGWDVYKGVCAACHSLKYLQYLHMVDTFLTEDEAKAEAAEAQIEDGPDETGAMFMRPGRLTDHIPNPYKNDAAAKAANNNALPLDLSLIMLARKDKAACGEDYVFALLTGYEECPAGVVLEEGQAYNPWFDGGVLSMPQQIFDESVEFGDGTPAYASQIAKDVCAFLTWVTQPYYNDLALFKLKLALFTPIIAIPLMWLKLWSWIPVKTEQMAWMRLAYRGRQARNMGQKRRNVYDVNNSTRLP